MTASSSIFEFAISPNLTGSLENPKSLFKDPIFLADACRFSKVPVPFTAALQFFGTL